LFVGAVDIDSKFACEDLEEQEEQKSMISEKRATSQNQYFAAREATEQS